MQWFWVGVYLAKLLGKGLRTDKFDIRNFFVFSTFFNLILNIAEAHEEGRKTMESAWNIMELHFWDKDVGLYKVF